MRFRKRPAEHREVLAEDENESTIDRAVSGDDAVAQVPLSIEPEICCAMRYERVELDERVRVKKQLQTFASRQLAAFVLLVDPFFAAAQQTRGAHFVEAREL